MADFEKAYQFMIPNEVIRYGDPRCIFYSNDPDDKGGATAWGVTEEVARKHGYTGDMIDFTEAQSREVYREDYWKYDGITDQRVASKLFDMAVNMGPERAHKIIQMIVFPLNPERRDGVFGPKTLAAVNAHDPHELVAELAKSCGTFYRGLVAKEMKNQKFLTGWLRRAKRIPEA
jgi:lysozyme family protein